MSGMLIFYTDDDIGGLRLIVGPSCIGKALVITGGVGGRVDILGLG